MNTNLPNNMEDQEIDLSLITKNISSFFLRINTLIFNWIQFVFKNKIIIGTLFVIGVGLGFYLDVTQKKYDHQIIVTPNFGSTDYLYAKIDLIESKIEEKDTAFLKKIGIKDYTEISKIEIEPIVDIYKFISNNTQNFDLLKLMSEDGDLKKIIEENITSKNYPFHIISFSTKKRSSEEKTLNPLMDYFNDSDYYKSIQKEHLNNYKLKMKDNDAIISQIDLVLNQFSNNATSQKSDKLVYYNENTQLNDVIKTKDNLNREQGDIRLSLLNSDKVIKANSITSNIKNTKSINGKLKFILPLLFILLFFIGHLFRVFYRKQSLIAQQKN